MRNARCLLWIAPVILIALIPACALAAPDLSACPYKIVWESFRDGNGELYCANADGSNAVNLTNTPDANELYPHVSPDGTKVCFVIDQGEGDQKTRSVWYMNLNGSGRTKVADNGREPCWGPDSNTIAYLGSEFPQFTVTDYATKGLFFYDLTTQTHRQHPNQNLYHLYNICWGPDGKWFVTTVHAGMGYDHAILAFEADGQGVYNLGIPGCRPDLGPDGRKIAWGASDWVLQVADIDFTGPQPKVSNRRDVVTSKEPMKIYHIDWSPDGRWVTFARGPEGPKMSPAVEMIGINAQGWNICVADATKTNDWEAITSDGASNKEPDWAPLLRVGAP